MAKRFQGVIPKTPVFRREMYDIPTSYSERYNGISSGSDAHAVLFYGTQFGGFRIRKVPNYLQDMNGFMDEWFNSKKDGASVRFKPNTHFIRELGDISIEPLVRKRYKKEKFDDEYIGECCVSRTEVDEIEGVQDALNEFYASFRVNVPYPNSGVSAKDRVDLSRFNSVPHFQHRPRAGSRLYHSGPGSSFQRISNSIRPLMTINGQKAAEIDISAATIQMMNLAYEKLHGEVVIPKDYLTSNDPYALFLDRLKDTNLDRESLKDVLYTWAYSSKKGEKSSVVHKLYLMRAGISYDEFSGRFPRFFEMVDRLKKPPVDRADGNQPVFQFSSLDFPAPHVTIFREEANYAREVLKRACLDEGFVVLPVHDSFITLENRIGDLERIMAEASEEMYDYVLRFKRKF